MKVFLQKIALFFVIVTVMDVVFGWACGWLQENAKGGRIKGVHQTAKEQVADIVVMGSSRAHHHYASSVISEMTGMSTHNAGVDGSGIVLVSGLYDLMVERYSPRVIIYDIEPAFDIYVYAEDGNNTRYIGWLRPYYMHPEVKEIICRVDPSERVKNFSAMFRYNGKIADLLKDQFVVGDFTFDGYAPLQGEMKTDPDVKKFEEVPILDTLKLHMMEDFIAMLCASDTRLIMTASPKFGAVSSDVFAPVMALCKQYGVEFWDYYAAEEFQKMEYFKESMHMNDKGARMFSECIAKRINDKLL